MVALKQRSRSSFQNIIRFRDTDGRPLGEGKLPADAVLDVPMERRTCPYADSRAAHARPMNVSALQQVRRHWEDCRALLAWLRQLHVELTGAGAVTLSDLWRIARLGQSLPAWIVLRRDDPLPEDALPPAIAVAFKVVIGLTYAVQSQHLATWLAGTYDAHDAADRAGLIAHCDAHGLLVGAAEVCAGPPAMIAEIVDLLIDGPAQPLALPPCAAAIGDGAGFAAYAEHAVRFQAGAYVMDLFSHALGHVVVSTITPARFGARADVAAAAIGAVRDGMSKHPLLCPAIELPPDALTRLAHSIHRFMVGVSPVATRTDAGIIELIQTWSRSRAAAETALAWFVGGQPAPMLISILAAQLALEQHWLRLNRLGDRDLERALGHEPPPFPLARFDGALGATVLRQCLETLCDVTIEQDDDGARLRRGRDELSIPLAML